MAVKFTVHLLLKVQPKIQPAARGIILYMLPDNVIYKIRLNQRIGELILVNELPG
jgi:hypothetical protein